MTVEQIKEQISLKGTFDVIASGMWKRFLIEKASSYEWDEPKRANGVPILARTKLGPQIVNHRLHVPFDRMIVGTKSSYFASNIAVVFADEIPKEVSEFYRNTQFNTDANSVFEELATYAADSGTSFALLTKDGLDINITVIEPWQALVKYNRFTKKPEYACIYDKDTLTVYDGMNVTTYSIGSKAGKVSYDKTSVKPHGFGTVLRPGIPLIEFPNNPNRIGNAVTTISLADAYDISLSDLSSEISQTRLAYLLMKGLGQDDDKLLEQMKSSGIILVDDANGDARFITKDLKPEAVRLLQEDLRRLIFQGAASYDSANFSEGKTPSTAFEIQEMLHPLETDTQTTIKAWEKSLKYLDYIVQTFLTTWHGIAEYNLYNITRIFRRVAPKNIMGLLEQANRAGIVLSNGTLIELSGLQVDPLDEQKRIDEERPIEENDTENVAVNANAAAVGEESNVVTLNGAQVTSATQIVIAVGTGEITKEAAINMLGILFNLTVKQASDMVEGMTANEPQGPQNSTGPLSEEPGYIPPDNTGNESEPSGV